MGGYLGMTELKASKPELQRRKIPPPTPTVRTVKIETRSQHVVIQGEGTVKPLKEINLVPQVGGKVIDVSPELVNGGQFSKGDVLLQIDPIDYELAVTLADAKIKDAQSKLELAKEEAAAAREEWRIIKGAKANAKTKPPPLVAREPQLAAARARLEADRADLRKARLNLERTTLTAPFDGRVSQENVDTGQYVTPGQPLAGLYSTDAAEIMVPLEDDELYWLRVPGFTNGDGPGADATIRARLGGMNLTWAGEVVRAEGKIDERTRMINVVVRVMNPYAKRPPLAPGLYVTVEMQGRLLQDVATIPRSALHADDTVWVVDGAGRLHFRKINIAMVQGGNVLVRSGLDEEDLVVTSSFKGVTDGMAVQAADSKGKLVRGAPEEPAPPSPKQVVAGIEKRLKLTDQQIKDVRPILLEHSQGQGAIRKKHMGKGGPPNFRALGGDMRKLNQKTNGSLEKILTAEQMSEYATYQAEQRQKRMGRMGPRG
jgi:RND family efflux transporter MFP subunit